MMTLGREIKKARIDRGMKQKDLVAATGLSQKYLSEIERDTVDPRFSVVLTLARVLGLRLDALVRKDDYA